MTNTIESCLIQNRFWGFTTKSYKGQLVCQHLEKMIEDFFQNLAQRFFKENDLSDITWAMATSYRGFLETFMEVCCFGFDSTKPLIIYREYPLDGQNQPDFGIVNDQKIFIVESKLRDRNYHIDQYTSFISKKKINAFGLIVNHKLNRLSIRKAKRMGVTIATWEGFKELLEEKINKNKFTREESTNIISYIHYLKEVCDIVEFKKMNFDNLASLYHFNALIQKIIKEYSRKDIECDLYFAGVKSFEEDCSGVYFSLNRIGRTQIRPWFGIYYDEILPSICFSFSGDKGWCDKVFHKYKKDAKREMFDIKRLNKYNEVDFELNKKYFNKFKKGSLEQQKRILENFLNAMVSEIKNVL